MSLIETMNYTTIGTPPADGLRLRVYALSTCAFCERAMQYLKEHKLAYEYLFVDHLDPEIKRNLKAELKEKYGNIPVFPLLIIDGSRVVSGFTEEKWREAIGQ